MKILFVTLSLIIFLSPAVAQAVHTTFVSEKGQNSESCAEIEIKWKNVAEGLCTSFDGVNWGLSNNSCTQEGTVTTVSGTVYCNE